MHKRVTLDHPGLRGRVRHTSNISDMRAVRGDESVLANRAAAARRAHAAAAAPAPAPEPVASAPEPAPETVAPPAPAPKTASKAFKKAVPLTRRTQRMSDIKKVVAHAPVAAKKMVAPPAAPAPKPAPARPKPVRAMNDIMPTQKAVRPAHSVVARAQAVQVPPIEAEEPPEEIIPRKLTVPEPVKKESFWAKFNFRRTGAEARPMTANLIYVMAVIVFGIGIGVAVDGYMSNREVDQQVAGLTTSEGSGTPGGLSSGYVPNEIPVNIQQITDYQVAPQEPRYIRIPEIGVGTTRVLEKGLDKNGAIDTPRGIYDTSWYANSALPGDQNGAMFISGHYVGPSQPGVFFHLKYLKEGEIVEIEQGDGTVHEFKVVKIVEFDLENVNMAQALTPVNPEKLGLNIMTCGGEWDTSIGLYDKRTLIMTEKVDT